MALIRWTVNQIYSYYSASCNIVLSPAVCQADNNIFSPTNPYVTGSRETQKKKEIASNERYFYNFFKSIVKRK